MCDESWNYSYCRERLFELAPFLNHFELAAGSQLNNELATSETLNFNKPNWRNYAKDMLDRPGHPTGYNGRSLDQGPFNLQ